MTADGSGAYHIDAASEGTSTIFRISKTTAAPGSYVRSCSLTGAADAAYNKGGCKAGSW